MAEVAGAASAGVGRGRLRGRLMGAAEAHIERRGHKTREDGGARQEVATVPSRHRDARRRKDARGRDLRSASGRIERRIGREIGHRRQPLALGAGDAHDGLGLLADPQLRDVDQPIDDVVAALVAVVDELGPVLRTDEEQRRRVGGRHVHRELDVGLGPVVEDAQRLPARRLAVHGLDPVAEVELVDGAAPAPQTTEAALAASAACAAICSCG